MRNDYYIKQRLSSGIQSAGAQGRGKGKGRYTDAGPGCLIKDFNRFHDKEYTGKAVIHPEKVGISMVRILTGSEMENIR